MRAWRTHAKFPRRSSLSRHRRSGTRRAKADSSVPTCGACGKAHWYPRAICPFCGSDKVEWRAASGRGTIYTFSVMRRAKEPYAIAYVTLAEGPAMLTNIVECDFDALRVGQTVSVVFRRRRTGRRCRCSSRFDV